MNAATLSWVDVLTGYAIMLLVTVIPIGLAAQFIWRWRIKRKTGEDSIRVVMQGGAASVPSPTT
ncbi:MAG: hypothetical protein ACR2OH_07080 [Microthrixaceae bacterium]